MRAALSPNTETSVPDSVKSPVRVFREPGPMLSRGADPARRSTVTVVPWEYPVVVALVNRARTSTGPSAARVVVASQLRAAGLPAVTATGQVTAEPSEALVTLAAGTLFQVSVSPRRYS